MQMFGFAKYDDNSFALRCAATAFAIAACVAFPLQAWADDSSLVSAAGSLSDDAAMVGASSADGENAALAVDHPAGVSSSITSDIVADSQVDASADDANGASADDGDGADSASGAAASSVENDAADSSQGSDSMQNANGVDAVEAALGSATDSADSADPDDAAKSGWVEDSGAVRYYDADGSAHTGWLVSDTYKAYGLQRYYIDADAHAAKPGYSADGWEHCTTSEGYVARGAYAADGLVYLADNDGRLSSADGWLVTDTFGQGLQRYYVCADKHAAVIGYSSAGWDHYTTSAGYVLRGGATVDGEMRYADNDGLLRESGWLVTDAFGQGLQRYWLDGFKVAKSQLVDAGDGWWAYARPEGYVVRGAYAVGGLVYLADNDGRLASADGWLVSDEYGQGLQRYYVYADKHAAVQGFSDDGWAHYTTGEGYVMRGKLHVGAGMLLADNGGKLVEATASEGWLVTDAYDGHLQRYRLDNSCEGHLGAHLGFFTIEGNEYYGRYSQGYVLRGKRIVGDGMLLADNDGVLAGSAASEGWLVTDKYDGELQRYRIDGSCEGHLGAHLGYFELDGDGYYGRYDTGYVVRNVVYTAPDGSKYYGNNDGVLGALPIVNLDVPCFNQYDAGLPTGCESAALTCVLRYYGFDLGDCTMADDWIPRSDWDFVWSFWGNPHSYSGVMICSPGIVNAANNFLSSCGSNLRAYNVSGSSLYDLRNYLYDGNPVIIWTSDHQEELSDPAAWQDGYTFYPGTHTVVLKGYNPDTDEVYLCDTIDGYTTWDRSYLEGIFATNGQQAVVIK